MEKSVSSNEMFTPFNRIFSLAIDIDNLTEVYKTNAIFTSGDKATSTILIKLNKGENSLDLTNCVITAYFSCANGDLFYQETTILDNTEGLVGIDLKTDVLIPGINRMTLKVVYNDTDIMYSPFVEYKVTKTILDSTAATDNRVSLVEKLLEDVQITADDIEKLKEQIVTKLQEVDAVKAEIEQKLEEFNSKIGDASKITKTITYGNNQEVLECIDNNITIPGDLHNINVKDYESLTNTENNGEITWDNAFQKAFDMLENGGVLTIPDGTYLIKNRATLQNKEGIIINCAGTIKPMSGQTAKIGTISIKNVHNSMLNGLIFDGNRSGVTPPSTFGIESLINIDNCTNIVFNNLIAFDVSSILLNSNEGLENIIFNNTYAKNIGEHVFYFGGNGSSNIKFNNLYCENLGICSVNANRSVGVIKLRNKAADNRLHDNIVVDGFYFKNTVINADNDRQLIQAFDTKNVVIRNGQVEGEDTSIFATNISLDSLICDNVIFNGRRIVHGINKNSGYENIDTVISNTGKFKIQFFNCELKGKNDYSTDISLYSNCIINTNNEHYTSSMATNINNEVIFDRCSIYTNGSNGRLNFLFDNNTVSNLEFSNTKFFGDTTTTQPLVMANSNIDKKGTVDVTFSEVTVKDELKNFYQGDNTVNLTIRDSFINSALSINSNKKIKNLNISNTRIKTFSNLDTLTNILSANNVMYTDGSRKDLKVYRQYCKYSEDNIIESRYQRVGPINLKHLIITNDDFCKFTCSINDENNIVINPVNPITTNTSTSQGSTSTTGSTVTTKASSPGGTNFTIIYQYQNAK